MKRGYQTFDWLIAALAAVVVMVAAGSAMASEPLHARISFDAGGAMIKGLSDADWSFATLNTLVLPGDTLWVDKKGTLELELAGGSFLRMADGSKAEIKSLPPTAEITGWTGSFYVQRISRSTGQFFFETPACTVDIAPDTLVRLDLVGDGATTVSVRWGRVTVRTPQGAPVGLNEGRRVYVDPGMLPSMAVPFDRSVDDPFDAWNRDRTQLLALGPQKTPAPIASSVIGVSDLEPYGDWVVVEQQYYWRPTVVVDYVPYRYGYWSYVPGCGNVWVGDYPFCYVTSHYGRWTYNSGYGWIWCYQERWCPAAVATVRMGPNLVWCPLDPWDRPVVIQGGCYTVGDWQIGIYASTYCPVDAFMMGPGVVYPCTPQVVTHYPPNEVNIWNINIYADDWTHHAPRPPRPGHGPGHGTDPGHTDSPFEVRNYFPQRSIRGPASLDGGQASVRTASLEQEIGPRRSVVAGTSQSPRASRTPMGNGQRSAQVREVRDLPVERKQMDSEPTTSARLARSVTMSPDAAARQDRMPRPSTDGAGIKPGQLPEDAVRHTQDVPRPDGRDASRTRPDEMTPVTRENRETRQVAPPQDYQATPRQTRTRTIAPEGSEPQVTQPRDYQPSGRETRTRTIAPERSEPQVTQPRDAQPSGRETRTRTVAPETRAPESSSPREMRTMPERPPSRESSRPDTGSLRRSTTVPDRQERTAEPQTMNRGSGVIRREFDAKPVMRVERPSVSMPEMPQMPSRPDAGSQRSTRSYSTVDRPYSAPVSRDSGLGTSRVFDSPAPSSRGMESREMSAPSRGMSSHEMSAPSRGMRSVGESGGSSRGRR